ncbi:MAG: FAD-dependent oxidoreductase [Bacteroidota bacterium]
MRSCTSLFDWTAIPSFLLPLLLLFSSCAPNEPPAAYDVLVLGEGTGAAAAAIQSARSGAQTLLVSPYEWLGGMLTTAGVSATDGNHQLPAGLWGEYRQLLRQHYGGADSLFTGWVSNTMFEPKVGAQCWKQLADTESKLKVYYDSRWEQMEQREEGWQVALRRKNGSREVVRAKVLIDGTDLGDVAATAGARYKVGMDARSESGEAMAPEQGNTILQDLTYVAILQDYGPGSDKTLPRPADYDPSPFYCACKSANCDDEQAHDCDKMLSYGQLPNKKYMINWPKSGNDYYANVLDKSEAERAAIYQKAKAYTLSFVYYIQNDLGYRHLGLAEDEYPTADGLPFYPYHREGRRIEGLSYLTVNDITAPYSASLYRCGIAVGDYPIDHHHDEHPNAPTIDFPKVPAFNIPLGCLIPEGVSNLLVADKAISVSNIVNGSSRLQPVVIQLGQAAGLVAAMAAREGRSPEQLDIRAVQQAVLDYQGYLMPFIDVPTDDPHFAAIQRVAAAGLLRGKGVPFQWANQCWFYPDSLVDARQLYSDIADFYPNPNPKDSEYLSTAEAVLLLAEMLRTQQKDTPDTEDLQTAIAEGWNTGLRLPSDYSPDRPISRRELAVLLDKWLDPFHAKKIDFNGRFQ